MTNIPTISTKEALSMDNLFPEERESKLIYLGEDDYVKVRVGSGNGPYGRTVDATFKTPNSIELDALQRMVTHLQAAMGVFYA